MITENQYTHYSEVARAILSLKRSGQHSGVDCNVTEKGRLAVPALLERLNVPNSVKSAG